MEREYEYVSVPLPSELAQLLHDYGQALGIPDNWVITHLAMYGAGGDALGSADLRLYGTLEEADSWFIAQGQTATDDR